jgi:hypothetical protein
LYNDKAKPFNSERTPMVKEAGAQEVFSDIVQKTKERKKENRMEIVLWKQHGEENVHLYRNHCIFLIKHYFSQRIPCYFKWVSRNDCSGLERIVTGKGDRKADLIGWHLILNKSNVHIARNGR